MHWAKKERIWQELRDGKRILRHYFVHEVTSRLFKLIMTLTNRYNPSLHTKRGSITLKSTLNFNICDWYFSYPVMRYPENERNTGYYPNQPMRAHHYALVTTCMLIKVLSIDNYGVYCTIIRCHYLLVIL